MKPAGEHSKPPQEKRGKRKTILELMTDGKEVDEALKRGVREALLRHKKLGQSIVVWQDGKVVEIPPDQIPG